MEAQNLFDLFDADTIEPGSTVHSNSHCHALVENPFAWDDEDNSEA